MLLQFKIRNFRSIRDEIIIDMKTSKLREDLNNSILVKKESYLNSLVFYGRNASGKSNIMKAFHAIGYLVNVSDIFKKGELLDIHSPYKFDKISKNKPTEFEVVFLSNGIKYLYEFKFNINKIFYEALYFYPKNIKSLLYIRDDSGIQSGDYLKWDKKSIEDNILENQLVLSKSARNNIEFLNDAFLFFKKMWPFTLESSDYEGRISPRISQKLNSDENFRKNILNLLKAADTNILDLIIKENTDLNIPPNASEAEKKWINERFKFDIKTAHNLFDEGKQIGVELLDWNDESFGTRKLLFLSNMIITSLQEGGVLVVDELDKSLHPLLTRMLIKLFHSTKNNPQGAQLLFVTHDATLLDSDLFRRDQICFVEKDYEGSTQVYKLSDIKGVRKNIPYDKYYMSGQFKGIPIITDVELEL